MKETLELQNSKGETARVDKGSEAEAFFRAKGYREKDEKAAAVQETDEGADEKPASGRTTGRGR